MTLAQRIQQDLVTAMKARDADTVAALRMALAAVRNAAVAGSRRGEVSDDEALALLEREARKRTEAAEAYTGAGRPELAAKEARELEVLRRYLPRPLDARELEDAVDQAIAEAGASAPSDLGRVMSVVMPKVRGRADGRQVNALVRERLQAPR